MDAEKGIKVYGQTGEIEGNVVDRLTKKELNKIVEDAGFKCGKDYLDWLRNEIQCFEPFPGGEVVQDFRRWEKTMRRQTLITVEEESEDRNEENDHLKIKRNSNEFEELAAELNPFIKMMRLPVINVWESFEDQKSKLWFGVEKQKSHASEPEENWFPVVWEEEKEDEEEERELFAEPEPNKAKRRSWFSRKFLGRHRCENRMPKTPGFFSRLFLRCFH